jgi:hypothetical protein
MQESTPENARTWRDLSDQLTPAQITELQREERTRCDPGALLWQARRYTEAALGDLLQGDIEARPTPPRSIHGRRATTNTAGREPSKAHAGRLLASLWKSSACRGRVAFDGVQASSRYPGGLALRLARVVRYRDDKSPAAADTIDTVRALY